MRSVMLGTGAYLPERVVTNHDLEKTIDTSDSWIRERTGITRRHVAAEGQNTSHLATNAANDALRNTGIDPTTLDLLIVATSTPDDTMPATAVKVQHAIGMTGGAAFDINAACSGFVYATTLADASIRSGQGKRVMVIGAETYSRILDWEDRTTCILFGDGAAAVIYEGQENTDRGVLHSFMRSDGQYVGLLGTTGGVASTQQAGKLFMAGKEVFRHAVPKMSAAVEEALQQAGLTVADIDWLVPHQANLRIMSSVAQKLGVGEGKVVSTVPIHANTSGASIPLALHVARTDGRLKNRQIVACPALGAGFTWGACLFCA
ncbi:MAG: beta-ketoacyl-ACP synthase III [Alphaproteobacteria bacterium]